MIDKIGRVDRIDKNIETVTRPGMYFFEAWQDEAGGIPLTKWTVTDPASGTPWSRGVSTAFLRATTVPNLNETARLVTKQRWEIGPDLWGTNTIIRRVTLEFMLKLANVGNLDESLTFFGLTTGTGDNRGSNNIIGWAILADVLQSVTDAAGTETENTTFGETITDWNKLKIAIYEGHVKFYINEIEVADHTTNLPDIPMYLNYFLDTAGVGTATIELGIVRLWSEDIVR